METKDWLTFVVAAYGAILSTILAVNIFFTNRRRIKVILEIQQIPLRSGYKRVSFREKPHLSLWITNIGHRPITITKVILSATSYNSFSSFLTSRLVPDFLHTRYIPVVVNLDEEFKLPCKLDDGAATNIVLPEKIRDTYDQSRFWVAYRFWVFDGEGNIYTKYTTRVFEKVDRLGGQYIYY